MMETILPPSLRTRLFQSLNMTTSVKGKSRLLDQALLLLIVLNVLAVILESVPRLGERYQTFFLFFETFSVAVFSLEYGLRVWVIIEDPAYQNPITGRLRYLLTPMALVDLLAVLPFYLTFWVIDLRFLRILRLIRLLRVMKIARYSQTLQLFSRVLHQTRTEVLLTLILMMVLLLISSSLMYLAEHDAQPSAFSSIPAAMWWAIATLTTVGYGDIYPITPLGKILASLIAIFGIGMFALPTGVLGAAFLQEVQRRKVPERCPHCGKSLGPDHEGKNE